MDHFVLACYWIVDLASFFAGAWQSAAGAARVIERAAVVVSHLNEHEIAWLRRCQDPVPASLGLKRATAAATDGVVLDFDLAGVKELDEWIAPAYLARRAIFDRRIADDEQRRFGTFIRLDGNRD